MYLLQCQRGHLVVIENWFLSIAEILCGFKQLCNFSVFKPHLKSKATENKQDLEISKIQRKREKLLGTFEPFLKEVDRSCL